jgi:hypothetical protein
MLERRDREPQRLFNLMARIGTAEFHVGMQAMITTPAAGRLYLGVSDSDHQDNRGAFVVRVHDPAAPQAAESQPAAYRAAYESDMRAFIDEVDRTYPFFDLKSIRQDWLVKKEGLLRKTADCESDAQFVQIVWDAFLCLRDSHVRIYDSKVKMPRLNREHYPSLCFLPAVDGRVVFMHAPPGQADSLPAGTVVKSIDGVDARRYLEERAKQAWASGGRFSSPQRARLYEYRLPLSGKKGEKHTLVCITGQKEQELIVQNNAEMGGWPHTYNLPKDLKRVGRSYFYGKLPSGIGYMYLRRVDGSVTQGMREALTTHAEVKGWIVDLRGNGGGGYGRDLIELVRAVPRPVAVLIDAGCMSAGETLARDFIRETNARVFGSRSAGASSAKRMWRFPSGIMTISLPTRSRWRHDGEKIEFNGIVPDVEVEAVPEEVQQGLNSCIVRAEEYIKSLPPSASRANEEEDDVTD